LGTIKILLINDLEQDRTLLHRLLSSQDDFEITAFGIDGYDAVKLSAALHPDIAVIGLRKDYIDGPDLTPLIKRKSPQTAVIVLSAFDDDRYISKALSSGVSGYLRMQADIEELAVSIRTAYSGGCYISPKVVVRAFNALSQIDQYRQIFHTVFPARKMKALPANISPVERQIMSFIGQGRSSKEIAVCLRLKPGTVRNYLSSAMHKAGLKSRTQVAIYALWNGLIDPPE
jgi:DNA-binding NarL/FixJ family response regulator